MLNKLNEPTRVFDSKLTVKALRPNGYKNTAFAIASLIDNSLDAKANNITVLTLSKKIKDSSRTQKYRVHNLAVLDDGTGMDLNSLSSCLSLGWSSKSDYKQTIGRFGFELFGSFISQSRQIEVYSWKNGRCYMTSLDIDNREFIERGLLRPICKSEIPHTIRKNFFHLIKPNGCLVVWGQLDNIDYSNPVLLQNQLSEELSRVYRYYLDNSDPFKNDIKIKFCDINIAENCIKSEIDLKANDPLYLLEPSNVPGSDGKATNELFEDPYSIEIEYAPGKWSKVEIRLSIALPSTQVGEPDERDRGHTELGKHYLKNTGISFVRAAREIDFGSFGFLKNANDPRNRWWGAEVRFLPELDELFGVTNNKQQIRGFKRLDLQKDKEFVDSLMEISDDEDNAGCYRARLHLALNKHLDTKIANMMAVIRKRRKSYGSKYAKSNSSDIAFDRDTKVNEIKSSPSIETSKNSLSEKFEISLN